MSCNNLLWWMILLIVCFHQYDCKSFGVLGWRGGRRRNQPRLYQERRNQNENRNGDSYKIRNGFVSVRGGGEDDTYIHNQGKEDQYGSLPPTVFAPDGRLYMVERKARDACNIKDASSPLVVAIKFDNGILMLSTLPSSPYAYHSVNDDEEEKEEVIPLLLLSSNNKNNDVKEPISIVSSTLAVATGGNAVDSCILLQRVLNVVSSQLEFYSGGSLWSMSSAEQQTIRSAIVARKIADMLQLPTQSTGSRAGRLLASSALVVGYDSCNSGNEKYNIWRIDPTGQFWNCQAAAIGRGAGTVESAILQHVKKQCYNNTDDEESSTNDCDIAQFWKKINCQDALKLACQCMMENQNSSNDKNNKSFHPMQGVIIRQNNDNGRRKVEVLSYSTLQNIIYSFQESHTDIPTYD